VPTAHLIHIIQVAVNSWRYFSFDLTRKLALGNTSFGFTLHVDHAEYNPNINITFAVSSTQGNAQVTQSLRRDITYCLCAAVCHVDVDY
jgi:hypothetical protein